LTADTRGSVTARAIREKRVLHIEDTQADPEHAEGLLGRQPRRTVISVPLLREGEAIGAITLNRRTVNPFTPRQTALLETFADQAVIAIENARLFEAEQTRTKELTESLEYQTATSEVLAVISRSPDALQPVVDSISETAARLCGADWAFIRTLGPDGQYHAVSFEGVPGAFVDLMLSRTLTPGRGLIAGRALLERRKIHVDDVFADPDWSEEQLEIARAGQFHTVLAVPLLRAGAPIGIIVLLRTKVAPFSKRQIDLVSIFADQAVIAVNNVGLFEAEQASKSELQAALNQQTATADVLKVISRSAFDLPKILDTLVESAARLCDSYDTAILQKDGDVLRIVSHRGHIPSIGRQGTVPQARGAAVWRAVLERHTIHLPDVQAETDEYPESSDIARRLGYHTIMAVPLVGAGEAVGAITLRRAEVRPFSNRQIELLQTFADQAVIAIENARLFEEVQSRTRELAKIVEDLEVASAHKSQFVANMSHELRTPLAAILGYAELMQEGFYGEPSPKSMDALTRIRSKGKHLLGLINTVLDIAKIESGQFTLNISEYDVLSIVETVRSATESLAQNKKLALKTDVAKKLPIGLGDEQRLTQVLLNLVGNAIKFTDNGEVRVSAVAANGTFAVSVADTGPGIPPDQLTRVFEQFHQVDSSNTKAKGGTGLGLAISKQIVEMHGGRIWVESELGKGSVFRMELPTRAEFKKVAP
jgi:signal transduction histidine kinase/putative methionine-R-sulfoxide reductase with GAF domain